MARLSWLDRVPVGSARLALSGSLALAAAVATVALSEGDSLALGAVAAVLLPVGLGLLFLAAARRWGAMLLQILLRPDRETRNCMNAITQVLTRESTVAAPQSIPMIAATLRWSEENVVRTLGWLQASGDIVEDVDIESGRFSYSLMATPRDLHDRLHR
jgi:hypothetical protein